MTNAVKQIVDELVTKNKEMEALKKDFVEKLRPQVAEIFRPVFDQIPSVQALVWTQYTPYFNDGDECTFRKGELYVATKRTLEKLEEEEEDIDSVYEEEFMFDISDLAADKANDWWFEKETKEPKDYYTDVVEAYRELSDKEREVLKELSDVYNNIPEDTIQDLFGDHVRVVVYKDKVDISDYDHD